MSEFLLREITGSGFCGMYTPQARSRARLHYKLDCILRAAFEQRTFVALEMETGRIQLCNQFQIGFEDQPFAHAAMAGMARRAAEFGSDITVSELVVGMEKPTKFITFRNTQTGAYVEPYYGSFLSDDTSPVYSISLAYLQEDVGAIKVDMIPVLSDGEVSRKYWSVSRAEVHDLLTKWNSMQKVPGPQCLSCDTLNCTFKDGFEKHFQNYLKQKQAADQAAEEIRQHLIYRGPSEVGYHTAYMKETVRRTAIDEKLEAWLDSLMAETTDWRDYIKPDSIAIAKAIKEKKLDKKFGEIFKEAKYYTIETRSNLGRT